MTKALITGASRGIGLALAKALLDRGVFVFAGARTPGRAGGLQKLHKAVPKSLKVVSLDVTNARSVRAAVKAVARDTPSLDILVNNAAVLLEAFHAPFEELDPDWFTQTAEVNVTGVARVTQAFLPLLLGSKSARAVNISSGAGSIGGKSDAGYYCYGASKAALNHLTVGLSHELRAKGVTVVALSPGWVRTDMGGADAGLSPEESASAIADTILKLKPAASGSFLDRHGRRGEYRW